MSSEPPDTVMAGKGSNTAGSDTALLEALWRGDELAAALRAAQAALAARERDLAQAQQTIAELSEIVDAAQAALEKARAEAADAGEAAANERRLRETVAAELFAVVRRAGQESGAPKTIPAVVRRLLSVRWWRSLGRAPTS